MAPQAEASTEVVSALIAATPSPTPPISASNGSADFADGARYQSGTSIVGGAVATSATSMASGAEGVGGPHAGHDGGDGDEYEYEEVCEEDAQSAGNVKADTSALATPADTSPTPTALGNPSAATSGTPMADGGLAGGADGYEYKEVCEDEDGPAQRGSSSASGAGGAGGMASASVDVGVVAATSAAVPISPASGSSGPAALASTGSASASTHGATPAGGTCSTHGEWKCSGQALQVCHYIDTTTLGWITLADCPEGCSDGENVGCMAASAVPGPIGAATASAIIAVGTDTAIGSAAISSVANIQNTPLVSPSPVAPAGATSNGALQAVPPVPTTLSTAATFASPATSLAAAAATSADMPNAKASAAPVGAGATPESGF